MKNKNISRACLCCGPCHGRYGFGHASALRSSAPETEAAVMIMDNTRMARPKAKIVKRICPRPTVRPRPSVCSASRPSRPRSRASKGVLSNAKLAWMFENCFPNTLDTTVRYRKDDNGKDDTVVYTGDIHAMWLRDSGAQVWPLPSWPTRTSTCAVCWPAPPVRASSSIYAQCVLSTPTTRTPTISG